MSKITNRLCEIQIYIMYAVIVGSNALWCSGNTSDFDSDISGSTPDRVAKERRIQQYINDMILTSIIIL